MTFVSDRDPVASISVINVDGSGLASLPSGPADAGPAWSRDGTRMAFSRVVDGVPQIFTMRPDGSEVTQVTTGTLGAEFPAWSPDGRQLAFVVVEAHGDGVPETGIWAIGTDGTNLRRLTNQSSGDRAAWSPDGQSIAFGSSNDGQLWLVNPDGSGAHALTPGGDAGTDIFPTFSPDGTKLAVATTLDGSQFHIAVVNVRTGLGTTISTGPSNDQYPAWSRDGSAIAFTRFAGAEAALTSDIWLLFSDRGGPVNLTNDPVHSHTMAAWE